MAARFGEMLMNRRRHMGMSIQQVANVIKIRPQIIEYFEMGDFASMPPRGYAQGMISSYARYLGLNPREVVNTYFDELYEYERQTAHAGGRFQDAAGYVSPRSATATGRFMIVDNSRISSRYAQRPPQAGYVSDATSGHEPVRITDTRQPGRTLASGSPARRGYQDTRVMSGGDLDRTRVQPRARTSSYRSDASSSRGQMASRRSGAGAPPRGPRSSGGSGNRGGRRPSGGGIDPRLLIGGVIAALAIVAALVFLLVRSCASTPETSDVSAATSPVSQAATTPASTTSPESPTTPETDTDEDGAASTDNPESPETAQEPQQTVIAITVEDGAQSWLEIKLNGQSIFANNVVGPLTQEYTVTSSIEITVNEPGNVRVTQNGEDVRWDTSIAGVARVSITAPQTPAAATTDTTGDDGSDDSASATE
ncbi:helix-turn-helix transcriptional regulator [Collinsella sp. An2]|uniref:helix-turn-helix domain-containing protein n=1 Tax=Collinsella sp. An2 TaxID=1965585 RepID=UPI000B38742D|nr:helix-turn-helix transcriptional regulator [Collinsella sp. An2]OUP07816.1 hypothetical protein B5F33_08135 [Collinsella sp. An2]